MLRHGLGLSLLLGSCLSRNSLLNSECLRRIMLLGQLCHAFLQTHSLSRCSCCPVLYKRLSRAVLLFQES
jgi:hypothetical protein